MIALPSKNTFLCLGSSGAVSDIEGPSVVTGGGNWLSPGCFANP